VLVLVPAQLLAGELRTSSGQCRAERPRPQTALTVISAPGFASAAMAAADGGTGEAISSNLPKSWGEIRCDDEYGHGYSDGMCMRGMY